MRLLTSTFKDNFSDRAITRILLEKPITINQGTLVSARKRNGINMGVERVMTYEVECSYCGERWERGGRVCLQGRTTQCRLITRGGVR